VEQMFLDERGIARERSGEAGDFHAFGELRD
jgi:hypothetical protein